MSADSWPGGEEPAPCTLRDFPAFPLPTNQPTIQRERIKEYQVINSWKAERNRKHDKYNQTTEEAEKKREVRDFFSTSSLEHEAQRITLWTPKIHPRHSANIE